MKKEKREDTFIKPPFYKGGIKAMNEMIYGSLQFPKEAMINKIEGVVIIKYDINHLGYVIDARVMKSLGYGCDEEALRIVKLLQFEVPKNPRKLKVVFHKDIHIHFKSSANKSIPQEAQVEQTPLQINYTIITENQQTMIAAPAASTVKKVYTYTLKF